MVELPKENLRIKTDEIFLKYKYERIPTNFEERTEKGFLNSNISTRDSYKKLDLKEKETENDADNNTFCDSINNPDIPNEEENFNENILNNNFHNNFINIETKGLIDRKNSNLQNSYNNQKNSRNKNKINTQINHNIQDKSKIEQIKLLTSNLKDEDIIPLSIKIIYSLASFGKMSCLVLLKY